MEELRCIVKILYNKIPSDCIALVLQKLLPFYCKCNYHAYCGTKHLCRELPIYNDTLSALHNTNCTDTKYMLLSELAVHEQSNESAIHALRFHSTARKIRAFKRVLDASYIVLDFPSIKWIFRLYDIPNVLHNISSLIYDVHGLDICNHPVIFNYFSCVRVIYGARNLDESLNMLINAMNNNCPEKMNAIICDSPFYLTNRHGQLWHSKLVRNIRSAFKYINRVELQYEDFNSMLEQLNVKPLP